MFQAFVDGPQPAEVSQPDAERLIWWETMIGMAGFELQAPRGSGLWSIAVLTSVAWRRTF